MHPVSKPSAVLCQDFVSRGVVAQSAAAYARDITLTFCLTSEVPLNAHSSCILLIYHI